MAQQQVQTITINGQQYQIVNPSALSQSGSIQTITVGGEGAATSSTSGVVQYAATSQNGQTVFIPGTVASASASGPQIISVATTAPPPTAPSSAGPPTIEEASRKREIRLLKNREAARECRNKKKEYIKCLENRVGKIFTLALFQSNKMIWALTKEKHKIWPIFEIIEADEQPQSQMC